MGSTMSETPQNTGHAEANPLLRPWQTPFETPPFAEISPAHFLPAFERAFADHSAEVAAITHDPAVPDFANTITALERSGKLLSKVSAVFYDLVSANSNPEILAIDKEVSPRMARHWNPIMMNAVLFGRIALIHNNRATLGLTAEQMRLLERTYNNFHRAGAGLDETAKARRAAINERLAELGTSFSHHLLGRQAQRGAVGVDQCDPAEQHRVHHDRIPVPRHPRRDLLVDREDFRIGVGRDQVVEHGRNLREQLAGALQGGDGVGEVGYRRIMGDGGDLGRMVGEGALESRQEMLRQNLGKRRRLERRLPRPQQRVGFGMSGILRGFCHRASHSCREPSRGSRLGFDAFPLAKTP